MQHESPLNPSGPLFQQLQSLKESKDLLESVFNTLQIGISVFRAERDEKGNIIDFSLQITNKEVERQTQRTDLVGIWYAKEYPGIREVGIFDMMLRVFETGKPEQLEYFYKQPGFNKWFSCMFVKTGDDLIATNTELDKLKNFTLLRQAEDVALLGSWEYELVTKKFNWTPGMYSIFNLPEGKTVSPEIYTEYATENSRPIAQELTNCILSGKVDFEKTVDIMVNNHIKSIRVKGTAVKNTTNQPVSIVGVDIDVSQQVKLQREKSKLQSQYKEILASHNENILKITLKTQEEERKRISESLHNGLGQLLYGVKLSLDQLTSRTEDLELIKTIKKNTDALLMQAIKETRRISHELSPSILETFGLKVAVMDICQQFQQALNIKCDYQESSIQISKELELFIYRTIQELTTNILKHAQATEASIGVFFGKHQVNINIQDNGRGITAGQKQDGIGLKTIQNQLNLLKGTFKLTSPNGTGTLISISIPHTTRKKTS